MSWHFKCEWDAFHLGFSIIYKESFLIGIGPLVFGWERD